MDVLANRAASESIFVDSCYKFDAGGDPDAITSLTHDELVNYYKKYYQAGNCAISFYGNCNPDKYLDLIEGYLQHAPDITDNIFESSSKVPAKSVALSYQLPSHLSEREGNLLLLSFLGPEVKSVDDDLDWQILNLLLFEHDHSPLRKALNETSFATSRWNYSGIATNSYAYACFGVHGATLSHKQQLKKLVIDVCRQVSKSDIPAAKRSYFIKKLEIAARTHQEPIDITIKLNTAWRFGQDPSSVFEVDAAVASLKDRIKDKRYFSNLLARLILNNPHLNFAYLKPEKDYNQTQSKQVAAALTKIKINNPEKILELETAIASQSEPNVALPGIKPGDIRTKLPRILHKIRRQQRTVVYQQKTNTKGLVYINLLFDLTNLPSHQLFPIYAEMIGRVGIKNYSALETMEKLETDIGTSIGAELLIKQDRSGKRAKSFLNIHGYALPKDFSKLLTYIVDYIQAPNLNEQAIINNLLQELKKDVAPSLAFNGSSTAIVAASRQLGLGGLWNHDFRGAGLAATLQKVDSSELVVRVQALTNSLSNRLAATIVSANANILDKCDLTLLKHFDYSVTQEDTLPSNGKNREHEAWILDTTTGFAARTYSIPPLSHPDAAAIAVMAEIVSNNLLHTLIREQGGAYGGRCKPWFGGGILSFFTVRDPSLAKSYAAFAQAVEYLCDGTHTREMVEDSICLIIGEIDAPSSPARAGFERAVQHFMGISAIDLNRFRSRILRVTKKDVQRVAQKYLKQAKHVDTVVCGQEQFAQEKLEHFVAKFIDS